MRIVLIRFMAISLGLLVTLSLACSILAWSDSLPESHIIGGIRFIRQKPHYCGPASLAMVLNYWGLNLTQDEVAKEVFNPSTNLTYIGDMVRYPRELGFFSRDFIGSIETIKYYIALDIPVIVLQKYSLKYPVGHYRVVIGYDDERKVMKVVDPAGGFIDINYTLFALLWKPGTTFTVINWTLVIYPKHMIIYEGTLTVTTTRTLTKTLTHIKTYTKTLTYTHTTTVTTFRYLYTTSTITLPIHIYITTTITETVKEIPRWSYTLIASLIIIIIALAVVCVAVSMKKK